MSTWLFILLLSNPLFKIISPTVTLETQVDSFLQSEWEKLEKSWGEVEVETLQVYLSTNMEDFESKTGHLVPDWGVGVALPEKNSIVLLLSKERNLKPRLQKVLKHELTHIFMYQLASGKKLPRWLEEGLAMREAFEWNLGQDIIVARAVITGSLIPLSGIDSLNYFRESKANLAYTISFLATTFLLREYGEENLKKILRGLDKETFENTFARETGIHYEVFLLEFSAYLKKRYGWINFLGDTFAFWILVSFMVIFLYLLKRHRTKKIISRWETEERIGRMGGDY